MSQLLATEKERVAPRGYYRVTIIQDGMERIEFDVGDLEYAQDYVDRFPLCSYRIYNDHGEIAYKTRDVS